MKNINTKRDIFFTQLKKLIKEYECFSKKDNLENLFQQLILNYKDKEVKDNELTNFLENINDLKVIFNNSEIILDFIKFISNRLIFTNIVYCIDFEIIVLSDNSLIHLKKIIDILCKNSFNVNYIGPPLYKIILKENSLDLCREKVEKIYNLIEGYIINNNIKSIIKINNDSEEIKQKKIKLKKIK